FVANSGEKKKVVLFDGKNEMGCKFYDEIYDLMLKDGIAAFRAKEGDKWKAVIFDGEKEKESELNDDLELLDFENGVLKFRYKNWEYSSLSF
ncbi:MAG: hypothetical protein J7K22_04455, partial [Nanoarchaeota archaeon]|nr:hypothetical protein [Nanoarchaeota archaeon]